MTQYECASGRWWLEVLERDFGTQSVGTQSESRVQRLYLQLFIVGILYYYSNFASGLLLRRNKELIKESATFYFSWNVSFCQWRDLAAISRKIISSESSFTASMALSEDIYCILTVCKRQISIPHFIVMGDLPPSPVDSKFRTLSLETKNQTNSVNSGSSKSNSEENWLLD